MLQVLAKAAEPGLPVGIYYYGTDGQRWELGGGLTPRLLPARNMRAHVPPYAVPAVPQTGGTQGLSRGALLAAALGACAGAAALLCAALVACGCCWLPRNVGCALGQPAHCAWGHAVSTRSGDGLLPLLAFPRVAVRRWAL